jgi:hypothetical protein
MIKNYPYLQAALLCEKITTDDAGRHTIHNEFCEYTMGYSQAFTILTIWRGAKDSAMTAYRETTEIIAPDGRVVAVGENGPFFIPDKTYRQVNSILLDNIDFTNNGIYQLRVTLFDNQNVPIVEVSYPITVT